MPKIKYMVGDVYTSPDKPLYKAMITRISKGRIFVETPTGFFKKDWYEGSCVNWNTLILLKRGEHNV